jgi:hypothetical protein
VTEITPSVARVARRILALEIGGATDPDSVAVAAHTVFQKLSLELSSFIGTGGLHAVVGRALHLAQDDFPFLGSIRTQEHPEPAYAGLQESVQARDIGEVTAGLTALIAAFLHLLSVFIGEDLTLRVAMRIWPEPGSQEPGRRFGEI